MIHEYPELPDWHFDGEELSLGVYKIYARDTSGHYVEATGFDLDALVEKCKKYALEIMMPK